MRHGSFVFFLFKANFLISGAQKYQGYLFLPQQPTTKPLLHTLKNAEHIGKAIFPPTSPEPSTPSRNTTLQNLKPLSPRKLTQEEKRQQLQQHRTDEANKATVSSYSTPVTPKAHNKQFPYSPSDSKAKRRLSFDETPKSETNGIEECQASGTTEKHTTSPAELSKGKSLPIPSELIDRLKTSESHEYPMLKSLSGIPTTGSTSPPPQTYPPMLFCSYQRPTPRFSGASAHPFLEPQSIDAKTDSSIPVYPQSIDARISPLPSPLTFLTWKKPVSFNPPCLFAIALSAH